MTHTRQAVRVRFQEFIEYAEEEPRARCRWGAGGVSVGARGRRNRSRSRTSSRMKYVMFKSGGEASTAILGEPRGRVRDSGAGTPAFQAARDGKLVALVNRRTRVRTRCPSSRNLKSTEATRLPVHRGGRVRPGPEGGHAGADPEEAWRTRCRRSMEAS